MKKKLSLVILIIFVMLLVIACGQSPVNTEKPEEDISSLQEENDRLKTENKKLKNQIDVLENKNLKEEKQNVVQEGDVIVDLIGKSTSSGKYSEQYVDFVFSITNNTGKSIKGIQGKATFKDLFGVDILPLGTDFTGITIEPGQTAIVDDLSFDCNQFMEDHMKLHNTAYDDLIFQYEVISIVFVDGSSKQGNY